MINPHHPYFPVVRVDTVKQLEGLRDTIYPIFWFQVLRCNKVLLVEKQTMKCLFRTELRNWRIRTQ